MLRRDPKDRRYRERLAGSYLASLLFHVLLAIALFSVIANSSEEGASESQIGGSVVTLEQRAPVVAQAPVKTEQAAPVPHAPAIAPVKHAQAARPAHAPQPPQHHELSKFEPTAPPNPTPLPQASPEPNVQPTQAVMEPQPSNELPAVPTSVPSVAAVAIAVKVPPTAAPSPVPTTVPTVQPSPRPPAPTAAPTAKPQTPAPAAPTTAPTATAAAVAKASAVPSSSPAAVARASAAPAPTAGVPSPSPTQGAAVAQTTKGTQPSPGPKGIGSPGPRAGNAGSQKAGPERPVAVNPTPSPIPAPKSTAKPQSSAPDINAKLRALLPHNDVNPTQGSIHPGVTLNSLEPTPPPDVLAATKYIYEERGSGSDALIKMWVTSVHREGPYTRCEGWMIRYAQASQPASQIGTATHPISGGINVGVSVGGAAHGGLGRPIVEEHASAICQERRLVPFAPSPGSSP